MIAGLEAVRAFMDIPGLPEGLGIVFVISCDEDRVAQAIQGRKTALGPRPELPGAILTKSDARRFLDRIFQFRLEIPTLPRQDMRSFALENLRKADPTLDEQVRAAGSTLDRVVDRLVHPDVQSPRNAIQLVNTFLQTWWLAATREAEGAGTDVRGGLAEGIVSAHPIAIAAVSALRVDFPDFFGDLQEDPDLLGRIMAVGIHRSREISEESISYQERLGTYLDKEGAFKSDHVRLRSALAYFADVRWPPSLEPLLRLSQDPATRRLGEGEPRLRRALLTGDVDGVLQEFGHRFDTGELTGEQCAKLQELHGRIVQYEVDTRRDASSFVVASLANRVPPDYRRALLTPIGRELARSEKLRWRLGVPRIRGMCSELGAEDRRAVSTALVSEFCRGESESLDFRLPTQEAPSLDEASDATAEAIETVVETLEAVGLPDGDRAQLRSWLGSRDVAVGDRRTRLPFAWLQELISTHEEALVGLLELDYASMVIEELQEGTMAGEQVDLSLQRVHDLFRVHSDRGEESRSAVWSELGRMTPLEATGVLEKVVSMADELQAAAEPATLSPVVGPLSVRLLEEHSADKEELLGIDLLVSLVQKATRDLPEEIGQNVIELASALGKSERTADHGIALCRALAVPDSDQGRTIADAWIADALSLPKATAKFLGQQVGSLVGESQQTAIAQALQPLATGAAVSKKKEASTRALVGAIPSSQVGFLNDFSNQLLDKIVQQHANPESYLYRTITILAELIDKGFRDRVGHRMAALLPNTVSDKALFGWIHHWMARRWRAPSDEVDPYSPEAVYDQAVQFAEASPESKWAHGPVQTAERMLANGLVDESKGVAAANAAAAIWVAHPAQGQALLEKLNDVPSASAIASMTSGLDWSDDSARENLRSAWSHLAEYSEERDGEILEAILSRSVVSAEGMADAELSSWIVALGGRASAVFATFLGTDLNDGQRARVLGGLSSHLDLISAEEAIRVLEEEMPQADTETSQTLEAAWPRFSARMVSSAERADMSSGLLRALSASPTKSKKKRIAEWLKDVGGESVARSAIRGGDLSEEDRDVLQEVFPAPRRWSRFSSAQD